MSSRRMVVPVAVLLLGAAGLPTSAAPLLLTDPEVAHLVAALETPNGTRMSWETRSREELFAIGCAPGFPGLVAISVDPPTRRELAQCAGSGVEIVTTIGREAVYLVAKEADGPGLTSRDLYLALAATRSESMGFVPNAARRWRDADPRLPDVELRVRVPALGDPPRALFARAVLEAGCRDVPAIGATFSRIERVRLCTEMRADGVVEQAGPGADPFAWLERAPAHAMAVVAQPAIARLDEKFAVLPLDGVVPTYSAVASGDYRASWAVYLTVVGQSALGAAVQVAAESTIGPDGAMAAAGLTPLVPGERVALRGRLFNAGGS